MKRILVVDDSMYTRSLIMDLLSDQDFELYQAADTNQMFTKIEEIQPDVVVIDIIMPGMNGLDAVKMLHKKQPGIKVIVCSAQGTQAVKDEAFSNGAVGYIQKPFSVDSLTEELNRAFQD